MSLQSVRKTIQVLEAITTFPDSRVGVSELAVNLGWSRASTHQYTSTLAESGWLVQNEKREYRLSPRAAIFGRFAVENSAVPLEVSRAMEALVKTLNEPMSYAVLNGNEAIIVERHEPKRPFAISQTAEPHLVLRTSASGHVLLAFDAHVGAKQFPDVTEDLEIIRRNGFAHTHSEWLGDVVDVVAVPIVFDDDCLGALSVIAPDGRLDVPEATRQLVAARQTIEAEMGSRSTSL